MTHRRFWVAHRRRFAQVGFDCATGRAEATLGPEESNAAVGEGLLNRPRSD